MIGTHHGPRGWFWRRWPDGSVKVTKRADDGAVVADTLISPAEWAEIVTHVSAPGQTDEGITLAQRFHSGQPTVTA